MGAAYIPQLSVLGPIIFLTQLIVMAMYEGAQTVVRTTEGDSKAFNVKVGLHQ